MIPIPARRVLFPVDFGGGSRRALAAAAPLTAPRARREFLFVSEILPLPAFGLPGPGLPRAERKRLMASLEKLAPGATARVEDGDPVSVIARRARRADLVVMATHGRVGLDRLVLGSVCEAVVRVSPAPVLVFKRRTGPIRAVLAPLVRAPYAETGLRLAAQAAAAIGVPLTALHVEAKGARGPNPRIFMSAMLARLPEDLKRRVQATILVRSGDPVTEIAREAGRCGLVALTAHRKSLLSDLVIGMTVERVLRHSTVPVLAAPSGKGVTLF